MANNEVKLELPNSVWIHDVVNVIYTVPFYGQLPNIFRGVIKRPDPVPTNDSPHFTVKKIYITESEEELFGFSSWC